VKSTLRVLHVFGALQPSGGETMFCIAAPLFAAEGVEAEIVSTGSELGTYAPQLAQAGYKLHHVPFSKTPAFFIDLFRLMRNGRYDVFHLHTERANFWIGLVALALQPRRVLQTVHSSFEFSGNLRLRRKVQRQILKALGLVSVAISPSVEKTERERFNISTRLIPNWYDSNRFTAPTESERQQAREALGIGADETVIVTVGNCSAIKNHTALLEALAQIPPLSRPLYLHVGIEEHEQPERKLAQELGIAERVRFLGALRDVRPALFAADIFVMPSLVEGFGIAAVEALATGLPALFSDVNGLRDFREVYDDLCYAKPDAFSIKIALEKLLAESSELRRARARKYPAISPRLYGIARGVVGYVEIYRGR
jgi:glycosyltransferase involved in cell wall biosynthesis